MALFFFPLHDGDRVADTVAARVTARRCGCLAALALSLAVCGSPAVAGTLVNMDTQFGTIQIDLFDELVPTTVDNFLSYVSAGAYTDTLVHRSTSIADSGIAVIQGGGFNFSESNTPFARIPTAAPINLESPRENTRGTIAMARAGLNTATSQWFINAVDNSGGLAPGDADGFAVFGWIVGKGMSVVETINGLPKTTVQNAAPLQNFANVPVRDAGDPITASNMVFTNGMTLVGEHPSFQNPVMRGDVINDGVLRVSDVHAVITDLLANGSHDVVGPFSGTNYLDVNGSGRISVADVNNVINALLSEGSSTAPLAAPRSAPLASPGFAVVPEPTSLSLGAIAGLTLAAATLWRRRRLVAARAAR